MIIADITLADRSCVGDLLSALFKRIGYANQHVLILYCEGQDDLLESWTAKASVKVMPSVKSGLDWPLVFKFLSRELLPERCKVPVTHATDFDTIYTYLADILQPAFAAYHARLKIKNWSALVPRLGQANDFVHVAPLRVSTPKTATANRPLISKSEVIKHLIDLLASPANGGRMPRSLLREALVRQDARFARAFPGVDFSTHVLAYISPFEHITLEKTRHGDFLVLSENRHRLQQPRASLQHGQPRSQDGDNDPRTAQLRRTLAEIDFGPFTRVRRLLFQEVADLAVTGKYRPVALLFEASYRVRGRKDLPQKSREIRWHKVATFLHNVYARAEVLKAKGKALKINSVGDLRLRVDDIDENWFDELECCILEALIESDRHIKPQDVRAIALIMFHSRDDSAEDRVLYLLERLEKEKRIRRSQYRPFHFMIPNRP